MTSLEAGYRFLLRAYPRRYQRQRGEELLATLMDSAQPAQTRPRPAETADVLGHALRLRTGLTMQTTVGRAVALAAPIGVAIAAGLALVGFRFGELPGHPSQSPGWDHYHFGVFVTPGVLLYALVAATWLLLLLRRSMATRLSAAVAILAAVAVWACARPLQLGRPNLTLLVCIAVCLVPVLLAPPTAVRAASKGSRIAATGTALTVFALGLMSFEGIGHIGWMGPGEVFYRSGASLVLYWSPAMPGVAALVLLLSAGVAIRHQSWDHWIAGTMIFIPCSVLAYGGGRYARSSLDESYLLMLAALALGALLASVGQIAVQRARTPAVPIDPAQREQL